MSALGRRRSIVNPASGRFQGQRRVEGGPCSLSQRERVGERGYGARRSAGTPSNLVTPLPPTASRRAPPSPFGRGILFGAKVRNGSKAVASLPPEIRHGLRHTGCPRQRQRKTPRGGRAAFQGSVR
nr:hypothetical protein [Caulobacter vibrioides]